MAPERDAGWTLRCPDSMASGYLGKLKGNLSQTVIFALGLA